MEELHFRNESELQETYNVLGWFYSIKLGQNSGDYRSVLEIHRKTKRLQQQFISNNIDVIALMMNPGGSSPLYPSDINVISNRDELASLYKHKKLVETEPDKTQYQLMRVMDNIPSINSIRVLNLSDLREINSVDLSNDLIRNTEHSIFSQQRKLELEIVWAPKVPILLAYGTKLSGLMQLVSSHLQGRVTFGVKSNNELFHHHPQRRFYSNRKWVEEIVRQIKQSSIFK